MPPNLSAKLRVDIKRHFSFALFLPFLFSSPFCFCVVGILLCRVVGVLHKFFFLSFAPSKTTSLFATRIKRALKLLPLFSFPHLPLFLTNLFAFLCARTHTPSQPLWLWTIFFALTVYFDYGHAAGIVIVLVFIVRRLNEYGDPSEKFHT